MQGEGDTPRGRTSPRDTTGASRGAVLTQGNFATEAFTLVTAGDISAADRYLAALPLFHVNGLANGLHAWLFSGCRMRLVERFEHAEALAWFRRLRLDVEHTKIAGELLHEITSRLGFLVDVGLDYLSLHRKAATLSGGEAQRIQLASQIGTGLTGVLYVLDEPTIGLHPRDNGRLIQAIARLRDLGNTLVVVEHDREMIAAADHVLDFGPGAGAFGGEITAAGNPSAIQKAKSSLTGRYLSGRENIPVPANRRPVPRVAPRTDLVMECDEGTNRKSKRRAVSPDTGERDVRWLTVVGARENNLKNLTVGFPLSRFTCVTGVSGSGKSTLVSSILFPALASRLHRATDAPGAHDRILGIEHVDKVIRVDQSRSA